MGIKEKFEEGFRYTKEELRQIADNQFNNDTIDERENGGYPFKNVKMIPITYNVRGILERLFDGLRNI
ncbi:hypothetical protein JW758_00905 [Candidatus Peregrinibacteria bacterium]|nr:hypothetical protein [Candidatus Peregrinibacteria bacterium]